MHVIIFVFSQKLSNFFCYFELENIIILKSFRSLVVLLRLRFVPYGRSGQLVLGCDRPILIYCNFLGYLSFFHVVAKNISI